jgi:hypothetical protein
MQSLRSCIRDPTLPRCYTQRCTIRLTRSTSCPTLDLLPVRATLSHYTAQSPVKTSASDVPPEWQVLQDSALWLAVMSIADGTDSKSQLLSSRPPASPQLPSFAGTPAVSCISLEDGSPDDWLIEGNLRVGGEQGKEDGHDLLPLFNSVIGQLFWTNCERVWVDASAPRPRSCVVISALKFSEIVTTPQHELEPVPPSAILIPSSLPHSADPSVCCFCNACPVHRASSWHQHAS